MSRFPELQGLSALTKLLAILLALLGVLAGLAAGGEVGFALAGVSLVGAFAYWIQARFIDILLQINNIVLDLHKRPAATATVGATPEKTSKPKPTNAERYAAMTARQELKTKVDMSAADDRPLAWEPLSSQMAHLRPGTFRMAGSPDSVVPGENVSLVLDGLGLSEAVRISLLDGEGRALWLTTTVTEWDGSLHVVIRIPGRLSPGEYVVHAANFTHAVTWPVKVVAPET